MSFETRVVRQSFPTSGLWPTAGHINWQMPTDGMSMSHLVPPDRSGEWRYRDMTILPTPTPGYTISNTPGVQTIVPAAIPPTEVLVIWERYIEEEQI